MSQTDKVSRYIVWLGILSICVSFWYIMIKLMMKGI